MNGITCCLFTAFRNALSSIRHGFALAVALQGCVYSEQSDGTTSSLSSSVDREEINAALRRVLIKPFPAPLIFRVDKDEFFYHPPLADNHNKSPWHKLYFSGKIENSEFVICQLGVIDTDWVDSHGKKFFELGQWLKEREEEAKPREICVTIFLGPNDHPFVRMNDFLLVYKASNGRYLFLERP
jgi:hypothetical protein